MLKHLKKAIDYFLAPVKQKLLIHRWRENESVKKLEVNWDAIHYNRTALINTIFTSKHYEYYLEIGCFDNTNFSSVIAKHKVGVDPVKGGTHRMTSDEYFLLNKEKFDVIFIDGLHTYKQVRKDLRNSVKALKTQGFIIIHDMIPRNWLEANVPRISGAWCGDVWKIGFELMASKGLDFRIVKADHGVCIVNINNSEEVTIEDMWDTLCEKGFDYFYDGISKLPIIEYDKGRDWLISKIANESSC